MFWGVGWCASIVCSKWFQPSSKGSYPPHPRCRLFSVVKNLEGHPILAAMIFCDGIHGAFPILDIMELKNFPRILKSHREITDGKPGGSTLKAMWRTGQSISRLSINRYKVGQPPKKIVVTTLTQPSVVNLGRFFKWYQKPFP